MKKSTYILILISSSLFFSCKKDFLETKPYTSIDATSAFSSVERIDAAMTGLYDLITTSSFNTHISLTSDVKGGDMLVVSTGNYSRFVTEYQYLQSPTAGYGEGFWRDAYKLITNCNVAITQISASPIPENIKKDYLAEARALRAWAHLQLVRLFAQPFAVDPSSPGIPVVDVVLAPADKIPPRGTVKDDYDFITSDLLFAKANISPTRTNNGGRLVLNSINGLLARVYLDQEKWKDASDHAVLARNGYSLAAASTLLNGFVDKTSEWIWTLAYRSDDNTGYLQIASFQEPYDIGYSTFRTPLSFINLFSTDDIRRNQFFVNKTKVQTGA
ncbi:MAG: RagB/SusD family nutrient uptake outer membrane protein [Ginsengibacter sp.]